MYERKFNKVIEGDLIIHGGLGQLWLIEKRDNKLIAKIVSYDSGMGYWEYVTDIGLFLEGNNTQIIGNIKSKKYNVKF